MSINLVLSTCPVGYKNPYLEKLPDTKKGKLLKTVITLKENPPTCRWAGPPAVGQGRQGCF